MNQPSPPNVNLSDKCSSFNKLTEKLFESPEKEKEQQKPSEKHISVSRTRRLINDISDIMENNEGQSAKTPLLKKTKLISKNRFFDNIINFLGKMIHPESVLILLFNLLRDLFLIFFVFWVPIEVFVHIYMTRNLNLFFLVFFILEIIFKIKITYFDRNQGKFYTIFILIIDALCLISFGLTTPNETKKLFDFDLQERLYIGFRFLILLKSLLNILEKMHFGQKNIQKIIWTMLWGMFIGNFLTCLWCASSEISNSEKYWTLKYGLEGESQSQKYLYSIYYTTSFILPWGNSDFQPQNNSEVIFIIFCRIYGFVVTILIFIPQALNLWKANHKSEKEINTQRNVSALHEYMRDKNISLDLIIKIERYFKLNCETENNFLNSLPEKLKDEVIIEINGQILKNFAAISENFSKDFLKALCLEIKQVHHSPKDIVFTNGELENHAIYFIQKGRVNIILDSLNNNKKILKILRENNFFGEISFFTGLPRSNSVEVQEFSTFNCIQRNVFLYILQKFPKDYEKYCLIREKIMLYNQYEGINCGCYHCHDFSHLINNCPSLHFERLPVKITYWNEILRAPFLRKRSKKTLHSLKKIKFIRQKSVAFAEAIFGVDQNKNKKPSFGKKNSKLQFDEDSLVPNDSLDQDDEEDCKEKFMTLLKEKEVAYKYSAYPIDQNDEEVYKKNFMKLLNEKQAEVEQPKQKKPDFGGWRIYEYIQEGVLKSEGIELENFDKVEKFTVYHPDANIDHFEKKINTKTF